MLTNYKGYDMLKSPRSRTHAIIIILVVFFSTPIKGIAQTKDNMIGSKEQNTNSHLSSPTKSPRKNKSLLKKFTRKKIKILKNKIPAVKKKVKTKKLSSNLLKTSSEIKALKNKLLLVTRQLTTAKKSDTQKGITIKKLQSESAKFSKKIKVLEKNLSLANTELKGLKETDAKKSEEIIKLNENINLLLDSIDDQEAELAELSIQSSVSEKYKEIIKCYRTALFTWDNLISRQGLTEKEYLVVRVDLRRSLFSCPPI
jgi:chromosome segregation ATPase